MGQGLADDIGENRTQGGGGGGGRGAVAVVARERDPPEGEAAVAGRPPYHFGRDKRGPSRVRGRRLRPREGAEVARERDNYGISITLS